MVLHYFTEFTLGSTDVEVCSRIEKMVRSKGTRTCQATEELEFLINIMFVCAKTAKMVQGAEEHARYSLIPEILIIPHEEIKHNTLQSNIGS